MKEIIDTDFGEKIYIETSFMCSSSPLVMVLLNTFTTDIFWFCSKFFSTNDDIIKQFWKLPGYKYSHEAESITGPYIKGKSKKQSLYCIFYMVQ